VSPHSPEWLEAHRPEFLEARRAYNAAHRAENAAWREAHREERAVYMAEWRAAHPSSVTESRQKHRAKRRGARLCEHPACLTVGPAALAWRTHEHACYLCGIPLRDIALDHVLPIAKGGVHCAENLRPACLPCNQHKHTRVLL
jgi:5-methylcytosine-specific restriction endonuclease McrA